MQFFYFFIVKIVLRLQQIFIFIEYRLKWLYKRKRLPTPGLAKGKRDPLSGIDFWSFQTGKTCFYLFIFSSALPARDLTSLLIITLPALKLRWPIVNIDLDLQFNYRVKKFLQIIVKIS